MFVDVPLERPTWRGPLFGPLLRIVCIVAACSYLATAQTRPSTPILLISIDTLRADRLGCYGAPRKTPHIDALAQAGSLFSAVSAPAPLTLPSHASLFTSTYPFVHGIDDNGQRLRPGASVLAGVLKSHGYRTAAFVGGFVMDRRFGLDQGFDVYDSSFPLVGDAPTDPGDIKRLGSDVVGAAVDWIDKNGPDPFFVFLHLYDLHTPYNIPPAYKERFRGWPQYDAELGYVDAVLGALWKALTTRDLFSKALIILTSDHGESLGDHGETTHGYYIYQSTIWVPLIVRWPLSRPRPSVRGSEPASLIDVAPTILEFLGLQSPSQFQGRSLVLDPRDAKGNQAPAAYSETLYGYNHFGVGSLRALRSGRYKYIDAPRPELYDLMSDPGETHNLYQSQRAQAQSLHERLLSMRRATTPGPSPPTRANADDMRRLRSLGYLGSSPVVSSSTARPDPKDRIAEYERYGEALTLASAGRLEQSNAALEQLLATFPGLLDARISLGVNKQRQRRHEQAIEQFQLALKEDSSSAMARFNLAASYFALNRLDDATREAEATLRLAPHHTRADELLGTIYVRRKQHDRAAVHFKRILEQSPDDYNAHHNLGVLATIGKEWTGAEKHLSAAARINPRGVEARNSLGSLYLLTGRLDEAANAFSEAVRLAPKHAPAYYNLGLVLRKQGKAREAAVRFREALALNPGMTVAQAALTELVKAGR